MADRPVGVDHERAGHSSLNPLLISLLGIAAGVVDEIHQLRVSSRKRGLFRHVVIFVDLNIVGASLIGTADVDAAGLGFRTRGSEKEPATEEE